MPTYDLKCDDCGHGFEKFITGYIKEEDKECPRCYSRKVSQQFSGSFGIGGSLPGKDGCGSGGGGGCGAPPRSGFG